MKTSKHFLSKAILLSLVCLSISSVNLLGENAYIGAPIVTGITPSSRPTECAQKVTISGANFVNVRSVIFGRTCVEFKVKNKNTIEAKAPEKGPGTVHIFVTTKEGVSQQSPADTFTYDSNWNIYCKK